MDAALLYAYILDLGWFLVLTGVLMLLAMTLILVSGDFWKPTSYEPGKDGKRQAAAATIFSANFANSRRAPRSRPSGQSF